MSEEKSYACGSGSKLIFACSGAADVGEITDRAARKMTSEGVGKMFCLAGVGGCVGPVMDGTKAASKILAIDGCPLDCAKNCLKQAGFAEFEHLRLTDIGMDKGSTPVSDEKVGEVVAQAKTVLTK